MTRSFWPPAVALIVCALLATAGVRSQRSLELRDPLSSAVPSTLEGYNSRDLLISDGELKAVGVTNYLSRVFQSPDTAAASTSPRFFTLYVGYYDRQTDGRGIHSPRNCLPGSGWEPLSNQLASIATASGTVTVNRYLIQKGQEQALVLYWYQGRGRVAANEYAVKWNLVRDAALRRRSDEALVRVVVPVRGSEAAALELASKVAGRIVSGLTAALPA